MRRRRAVLASAALLAAAPAARAQGLPPAYGALVVEPRHDGERVVFDLDGARARAQREGRHLYLYLGASDCRYCRRYEAFLDKHAAELVPQFAARYLLVDLRSALSVSAARLHFRAGGRSLAYAEFQKSIGDERARLLVYPSVWLLDGALKPLMQMPSGTGTFETVQEQVEILQLVQ